MARPKRVFSDVIIQRMEDMAINGCQNGTISHVLDISNTTLVRRFGKLLTKKRCERKELLRTNQTQLAKTNPAMAIFLGKNELGQADKQIVSTETEAPIVSEDERKAYEEAGKAFKLRMA